MIERLSSSWTNYFKVILPLIWIGGFGFGTCALWAGCFEEPSPPPTVMRLWILVVWVVGSSYLIWFARRLKEVTLMMDYLHVEDGTKEIDVPLSSINHMRESRFSHPRQIIIHVYPETEFGDTIVFIPRFRLYNPLGEHPTISMLRQLTNG